MATEIPYMTAPGSIVKILEKIKDAQTPESFSQDFLKTKLGFNGGNYMSFISWAKKTGLLSGDGVPTQCPIAHCCPLAADEVIRLEITVKDWFRLME